MPTIQKQTRSVLSNGYLRIPNMGNLPTEHRRRLPLTLGEFKTIIRADLGSPSCWGRHSSYSLVSKLAIAFWQGNPFTLARCWLLLEALHHVIKQTVR